MKKKEIKELIKTLEEILPTAFFGPMLSGKEGDYTKSIQRVINLLERKLEKKKRNKKNKNDFITSKKEAKEFNKIMNQPPAIKPKIQDALKLHDELIEEPNKAKEHYDKLNEECEIIKSRKDAEVFTETILNPPEPTEELKEAFNKYSGNEECDEIKESSDYDYKAIVEDLYKAKGLLWMPEINPHVNIGIKLAIEELKEKHKK